MWLKRSRAQAARRKSHDPLSFALVSLGWNILTTLKLLEHGSGSSLEAGRGQQTYLRSLPQCRLDEREWAGEEGAEPVAKEIDSTRLHQGLTGCGDEEEGAPGWLLGFWLNG